VGKYDGLDGSMLKIARKKDVHSLSTQPITCRLSCDRCQQIYQTQADLSQMLDWDVVSGVISKKALLTDPKIIDNVIRLRLHLDHPESFSYVGYSQPKNPSFGHFIQNYSTPIPNCLTTFTHFVELNLVVCVVIEIKQRFISCAKWYYSKPDTLLKKFLKERLIQILGRTTSPVISYKGDTTKWRCKREHTNVDELCDAFMLCAEFLVKWIWEQRFFILAGETNPGTFIEKAYNLLATFLMNEGTPDYPLESPVTHQLRERVFVGKILLEQPLTCQLCLEDIDLCSSRCFFSIPATRLSFRLMHYMSHVFYHASEILIRFPDHLLHNNGRRLGGS
jgi:hypothetical protein